VTTYQQESGLTTQQMIAMLMAQRYTIIKTLVCVVILTIFVTLLLPKTYVASSDIYLDFKTTDPLAGRLFSSAQDESYLQTQLDMIKSQAVAEKVIDLLGLATTEEYLKEVARNGKDKTQADLIKKIIAHTEVITRQSSRVIEIRYSAGSPIAARDFSNAIERAYVALNHQISSTAARSRREQYNAQLEHLRKEADDIQKKLTLYQQETGILDLSERDGIETRQLNDLTTALSNVQTQQLEAQSRKHATDQLLARGVRPDELPEIAQLPNINDLKSKLSDVNKRLADIQNVLASQHPKIRALREERDELLTRISREARGALNSQQLDSERLAAQEKNLRETVDKLSAELLLKKQHRDTITSYQRQLESVERIYNAALQKYDELLMASNINIPNVTVLRPAEIPTSHAKPILFKNLLAGLILGAILGLSIGLLRELNQRKIRCKDDMVRGTNLPMIGHVGVKLGSPA
jgi:succinoglycan biosynthesis transport protein ExoP